MFGRVFQVARTVAVAAAPRHAGVRTGVRAASSLADRNILVTGEPAATFAATFAPVLHLLPYWKRAICELCLSPSFTRVARCCSWRLAIGCSDPPLLIFCQTVCVVVWCARYVYFRCGQ
jgi:hypothetical protein